MATMRPDLLLAVISTLLFLLPTPATASRVDYKNKITHPCSKTMFPVQCQGAVKSFPENNTDEDPAMTLRSQMRAIIAETKSLMKSAAKLAADCSTDPATKNLLENICMHYYKNGVKFMGWMKEQIAMTPTSTKGPVFGDVELRDRFAWMLHEYRTCGEFLVMPNVQMTQSAAAAVDISPMKGKDINVIKMIHNLITITGQISFPPNAWSDKTW